MSPPDLPRSDLSPVPSPPADTPTADEQSAATLPAATRDRQVLVVGAGIAGLALTACLERSGYDPVLLADPDRTPRSRVATLRPPARSILDRLDVPDPPGTWSSRAGAVSVQVAGDDPDGGAETGDAGPLVASTRRLGERLWRCVPDDAVRTRAVTDVRAERGALLVTFDDGVREWFDLVVGADGPGSSVRRARDDAVEWTRLDQVELAVEGDTDDRPRDRWTSDGLIQTTPLPGGGVLARVTGPGAAGTDGGPPLAATPGPGGDALARVASASPESVESESVAQATGGAGGGDWGEGRVAYCGDAAFPVAPAAGLRTALALADAWVLAAQLLRGPADVTEAVEGYARRRCRRIERSLAGVDHPPGAGDGQDPALASVGRYRALALRRDREGGSTPERL